MANKLAHMGACLLVNRVSGSRSNQRHRHHRRFGLQAVLPHQRSEAAPAKGLWDERFNRTVGHMIIQSVRHRGLRQLLENDNPRFLAQALVDRVRNILTVLVLSEHVDEFVAQAPPGWRVHRLSGERRNEWSVSVSGNWRITFEENEGRISRLNLEDYH